jgi:hypothetical protein
MKSLIFSFLLLSFVTSAQTPFRFQRIAYGPEISFVQLDSAKGVRSTIIEYPKFLVVIELPMIDEGGGRATQLTEDVAKARRYLQYLTTEYKKPVKYILSTHWHLHSLSGITPFFEQGAQLVVAQSNWQYSLQEGLLPAPEAVRYQKQVISVTRDTVLLAKSTNPIDVWLLDESYRFKPTRDYLFFYLPRSKSLYASCMCAMNTLDFSQQPQFTYNSRVSDLDRAIRERKAPVEQLIKLTAEYDPKAGTYRDPVFSQTYFSEFKQRGTPMHEVVATYASTSLDILTHQRDSLQEALIRRPVSAAVINQVVYECLRQHAYLQAVAWALVLNQCYPGDLNYIDTLGEAYFQAGNARMAEHYGLLLNQKDSKQFPDPLATWAKNKLN